MLAAPWWRGLFLKGGKMEIERSMHDLSHLAFQVGKIGRLQTLSCIPCLPGDGVELDVVGAFRMSALRRGMAIDSVVDVLTFYVPHRHVYGEDWINFIQEGWDESVTLGTELVSSGRDIECLGAGSVGLNVPLPLWYRVGYQEIWNNYFRPPTTVSPRSDALSAWSEDERQYGYTCANLKAFWTALLANNVTSTDYNVSAAGSVVSLLDIDQQRGYLRTEQEREFFNVRYRDIIASLGGRTTIDVDNRPEMLMRSTLWASGYEVDGTTEVSLGQFSGRVVQPFRHRVPRWFAPEHGNIWTVALMRFPIVHEEENPFFLNNPNPTYAQLSGDPEIVSSQPPYGLRLSDVFASSSDNVVRGYVPFAQWYRSHPSNVHGKFDALNGFPFLWHVPLNTSQMVMCDPAEFDDIFQSDQLAHWQCHARINAPWMRRLPSARSSLMMGS